ncbi:MAG: hypothetical protein CSA36_04400 [Draconibacterium sp.]|nr:MAG: hypothetical protein CSA36_04400 [Draconibacterium sp.]
MNEEQHQPESVQETHRPQQTPPPNYLVFAILTTIFCCQVLGIVSIVYAAQVNSKWNAGDYNGAWESSRNAKTWAWISFGIGFVLLGFVLLSIFGVVLFGLGIDAL